MQIQLSKPNSKDIDFILVNYNKDTEQFVLNAFDVGI